MDYVVVQTDVSATKAAEEEVRRSRESCRALLHSLLPEHVASVLVADRRYMSDGMRSTISSSGYELFPAISASSRKLQSGVAKAGASVPVAGMEGDDGRGASLGAESGHRVPAIDDAGAGSGVSLQPGGCRSGVGDTIKADSRVDNAGADD